MKKLANNGRRPVGRPRHGAGQARQTTLKATLLEQNFVPKDVERVLDRSRTNVNNKINGLRFFSPDEAERVCHLVRRTRAELFWPHYRSVRGRLKLFYLAKTVCSKDHET